MLVQTDAICIRVLTSEKLLLAVGNQLLLLYIDVEGLTQRQQAYCLPRLKDKIHGIDHHKLESGESWLILFHAGREAYSVVLEKDNTFCQLRQIQLYYPKNKILTTHAHRRINDWISSLKLLGHNEACMITGHGVAIRLSDSDSSGEWYASELCASEDGSTLYCSHIFGTKWEDLLCFSGTALGLLIIWRPCGPNKGQILYSVSAHSGVVFSVDCDLDSGFLTTTSDDRSVKFWKMHRSDTAIDLKEMNYCFGHTARVFKSRIIRANGRHWVVSIGEDSNLCLWDESGNRIHRHRMEDGATLWNLDYDETTMTVFVCASNGNVSKFGVGCFLQTNQECLELHDITPDLDKEHLTKVKFHPTGSIVAVTNQNRILLLRNLRELDVVDEIGDQFKCSLLEVTDTLIYVAGNRRLNVYNLVQFHSISNAQQPPSKMPTADLYKQIELDFNLPELTQEGDQIQFSIVRSLHIFGDNSDLVLCDNNGRCLVYDLNVETLKSCHRLPRSNERWLTSAFRLDSKNLLLADRNGNLFLFDSQQRDPIFKIPYLHGKLGITHIQLEEKTPKGYFIATTGHDGHIKSVFLDRNERQLELYEARKTMISWIEKLFISTNRQLLVMGFNDSHFVVARGEQQDVLLEVDCGGGHRYWDLLLSDSDAGQDAKFIFIQHRRLKLVHVKQFGMEDSSSLLQVPRLCWHTKACNVVKILRHGDVVLFVSGGEDNILRLNKFCTDRKTLLEQPRKHLNCHISSIKSIHLVDDSSDPDRVLILSAGGRAQLCLTSLNSNQLERTKQELSFMLHSSDSDRSRWRTNRTASFDPETRFMCMTLIDSHLFIGCSDGFLRQFNLVRDHNSFKVDILQEVNYRRCFLHITKLALGNHNVLLTMATDGQICFWEPSNLSEPFYKLKHHASGINGFDVRPLSNAGQFLIGTGGDDQSVVVTKFKYEPEGSPKISVIRQCLGVGLHIGQVTGIRFSDESTLWSAGVDQRVILTDFSAWNNMVTLKQLQTCIADVKGLELMPESQSLFVYGCGFEFINTKD